MNLSVVTEIDMVEGYIGFYIESSNSYILRSDLNVINLENLTIEIRKTNSKPFLVATWYRPVFQPIYFRVTRTAWKLKFRGRFWTFYI